MCSETQTGETVLKRFLEMNHEHILSGHIGRLLQKMDSDSLMENPFNPKSNPNPNSKPNPNSNPNPNSKFNPDSNHNPNPNSRPNPNPN